MGGQRGMVRNLARVVVVHVVNLGTGFQQPVQRIAVLVQRDIQGGDAVTRASTDPLEQADIAFDARDQLGITGLGQAQLDQGANAVCITVEDVKISHESIPY